MSNKNTSNVGLLQRKCDCGNHTIAGGKCQECENKKRVLQRKSSNNAEHSQVPPIVHEVLNSSGRPLDAATRAFFESRFAHDFSGVRVHNDKNAAESAHAINALAYTVGKNVVFGAGQYAPTKESGRRLLAHELSHVVQQNGLMNHSSRETLKVSGRSNVFEREADAMADTVMNGGTVSSLTSDSVNLRKQEPIPIELVPVSPDEDKKLKERGINLPTVSDETWRSIGGIADNAGKSLSAPEKTQIEKLLKDAKMPAATPLATVKDAKFLLHDTSAEMSTARFKEEIPKGRGPMGAGVSAWVPRDDPAVVARPNFYEKNRPSTSEFEKGIDIIKQADREAAMREVWKVTNAATKGSSLDDALKDQSLTPEEITKIKGGAESFLKGSDTKVDGGKTAAAWAVGKICAATSASAAETGKEKELEASCKKLSKYYAERPGRVSSLVTVEIRQVGVKDSKDESEGAKNTCNPNNPNTKPMPNPPYTDNQYSNIALLYLRAAQTAGVFPEVTTHFVIDSFDQGHCDPRCFDLQKLYDTIATLLGHGKGSTYGVKPIYGLKSGSDTIWWSDKICGKPHP
ncbi:MAG: DUF4157 domain-containing protein [Pirellulaceae bacterium]